MAADDRQRAFTLLVKTYGQARRAATYLRWGGDVDGVTPSLWAGRGGRRNDRQDPVEQPAANGTPAVAEPVAPLLVAPAGPSGMPGGSPFANG